MSRRFRVPMDHPVVLTDVDARMLDDLLRLGAADTKALLVLRRSYKESPPAKMTHDTRRLTELMRGGWMSRFDPKLGVLTGSKPFYYTIETGRAMAAQETRTHHLEIPDDRWDAIRKSAAPLRERAIDHFTARGFSHELVESRLESNTKTFLRFYSGEASQARHKVLTAAAASILWYGARRRGIEPSPILPDGEADFSFSHEGKKLPIEPDLFFGLGALGIALETETGSQARHKIVDKVKNYMALFQRQGIAGLRTMTGMPDLTELQVIFSCARPAHARMIADVIGAQKGFGTQFFRIVTAGELGLDELPDGTKLSRDPFTANSALPDGTLLYDYLRDRISSPIFTTVSGSTLRCVSLLPA